jgi:ATP-binding cassette subfamily C protein CydD
LLTPEFFLPLRRLSAEYHAGSAGDAAARRIRAILDAGARPGGNGVTVAAAPAAAAPPAIRFAGVSVSYGGSRAALAGCSFSVAAGERVALVGETGAGKSTVAAVLLRFVDPDRGSVSVDGSPLDGWDEEAWRGRIAWVPQRPTVFRGTVADNIRLGAPDATDEAVRAAAASVGADEMFGSLTDGYATMLGADGVRLSGGERQLLAFARAALRDAPLVILDEATSHLDDDAHAGVLGRLPALLEDRSAIVIAHRLEVLPFVDRVVVMEGGRVVEATGGSTPAGAVLVAGGGS